MQIDRLIEQNVHFLLYINTDVLRTVKQGNDFFGGNGDHVCRGPALQSTCLPYHTPYSFYVPHQRSIHDATAKIQAGRTALTMRGIFRTADECRRSFWVLLRVLIPIAMLLSR